MISRRTLAYGRAPTTRSCARLSFDVATISMVRVIRRVFSTDRIRLRSSRPLATELLGERLDAPSQVGLGFFRDRFLFGDAIGDLWELGGHVRMELRFPISDLRDRNGVEQSLRHREDRHDLLGDRHGRVLRLLEYLDGACTAIQLSPRSGIEI